jgi:hypothetical protein
VAGYNIYTTDVATDVESALDVGYVPPDADGVARVTLVLEATSAYAINMTAYNEGGESDVSNQLYVAAEDPVCACDDGNPCTADSCDAAGCVNAPLDGAACDDGYEDTVNDQCVQGTCEGELLACVDDFDCDDGDVCNGLETCEGGTGCLAGFPLDCGEATACSVPLCDPSSGCFTEFQPDGTPCDDGLAETQGDVCWSGVCQGESVASAPPLAVYGVSPSEVSTGRHLLTIHGEGFVDGASLKLGDRRGLKVKNLRVVDSTALEATIEISPKGRKRGGLYDAIVSLPDGSRAVLEAALRVIQ